MSDKRRGLTAVLTLSNEQAQMAVRSTPDVMVGIDREATITWTNPAWQRVLGHASSSVVHHPLAQYIHPDDVGLFYRSIKRLKRKDLEYTRFRMFKADGGVALMGVSGSHFNTVHKIAYLTLRDETDRQQIEDELRESEAKFRALIDSASAGVILVDQTGQIVLANVRSEEMFGYGPGELLGQPVEVLIPDSLRARHAEHFQRFIDDPQMRQRGVVPGLDLVGRRKDGSEFPLEIGLSFARTRTGIVVMSFITDVERFRSLADAYLSGVVISELQPDGSFRQVYANEAVRDVLGYDPVEFLKVNTLDIAHPDEIERIRGVLIRLLSNPGAKVRGERFLVRHADGHYLTCEMNMTHVRGWGIMATFRDVTRDVVEMQRLIDQLQSVDRLRAKFIADVSHELRAPITNLALYMSLIERGRLEKRDEYLAVARDQTERLKQIVEDVLDISRLERQRAYPTLSPVQINDLVKTIVLDHQAAIESKELHVILDLSPTFPALMLDEVSIKRAVSNLISNAVRYTLHGSVMIRTAVVGERSKQACLSVRDTGVGIPAQDLPHIFERFYRASNVAQSSILGTGLGLSIVSEAMDLNGGAVNVQSEVGKGTQFTICLPLVKDAPGPDELIV